LNLKLIDMEWKNLPKEIQERMLECQVEQGNKRDESVFEENVCNDFNHGGFTFENTIEGGSFWTKVLIRENIDTFFEKYHKKNNNPKELLNEAIGLLKLINEESVFSYFGDGLIGDLLVKIDDDIIGDNGCGTTFTKYDIGKSAYYAKIIKDMDSKELCVFEDRIEKFTKFCGGDALSPLFKTMSELFYWIEANW
jgi:hypothetical protein